jgi:leucyl/phenylalanyl-tRNA--protein transferase
MSKIHLPCLGDDAAAPFPPTSQALLKPNGLLAWGGDLEPERLLAAYRLGIFPWYTESEPILWWSPAPRCVIFPADVHLSRRTRRRYHSGNYRITADTAFDQVIAACAAPRGNESGTWITKDMQCAFNRLHAEGYAHAVEIWRGNSLIGGIYGLALGKVFFGESMFSRETDASKIALVALCRQLTAWGYELLDCQVPNPHLRSLGAVQLSRAAFESRLHAGVNRSGNPGPWTGSFAVSERW